MSEIRIRRLDDGAWELSTSQMLDGRREELFPFFASAENLERITPAELQFRILPPAPTEMSEGALIDYRLRLSGLPLRWRTRIARWEPPVLFVDEQLRGPYAEWVHTHRFVEAGDCTLMEDHVRFRLPWGVLGGLAAPVVRRQLRRIFGYRRDALPAIIAGLSSRGRVAPEDTNAAAQGARGVRNGPG